MPIQIGMQSGRFFHIPGNQGAKLVCSTIRQR